MAKEERNTPIDETEVINTEEIRVVLQEKEKKEKKESWFKKLFKKNKK